MDRERFEFKNVTALSAIAVGQPGHRTFYLMAGEEGVWVRVWLEKGELQSLSVVIDEMLETIAQDGRHAPLQDGDRSSEIQLEPGVPPAGDFQLGRLAVGYDEGQDRIGLFVYSAEGGGDSPALICWITQAQAYTLAEKIDEVCASGRPLCGLCGGPIDPEGHVCPKSNGHHKVTL